MARKTYAVQDLTAKVNTMIDHAPTAPERRALASLLESVLFETGNYHGFNYLPSEIDPDTHTLRDDHDDTRRYYYQR